MDETTYSSAISSKPLLSQDSGITSGISPGGFSIAELPPPKGSRHQHFPSNRQRLEPHFPSVVLLTLHPVRAAKAALDILDISDRHHLAINGGQLQPEAMRCA